MRPKFIAVLSLSALALVGCSAAETPAAPTPTQDVTITKETLAPTASAQAPSETAEANEKAYLAELTYLLSDKKDDLPKKFQKKITDKYMLERGKMYCEKLKKNKNLEPITSGESTGIDYAIESRILGTARNMLCPEVVTN